jgi:7,8-dihydroneopterin aldolase/epimerase/oxygenase
MPVGQTEVALEGMRFHVRVGILPHERELEQPLEIDLAVRHGMGSNAVLDYRRLYETARECVAHPELTYLELIAEDIAAKALTLTGVTWCRVTIRKPHVSLGGPLLHARITIERTGD